MFPDELLMESSIFNRLKRKVAEEATLDVSKRHLTTFLAKFYPQIPHPDLESVTNGDLVDSVLQSVIQADDEAGVRAALARLTH